ncbi:MAG: hypothetical protein ACFFBS_05400 [Promethearchaeota archaeon]
MAEGGFRRGAISQILFFISALLLSLSYLIAASIGFLEDVMLSFASYVFLLIFGTVFTTANNDLIARFGGSRVGLTASIVGILTSLVGLIAYFILPIFPILLISLIALSMDHLAFGGTAILTGAFFLKYREYLQNKGSWGLTGLIYIIAGFALFISAARLFLPVFLSYLAVGYLLLLVAIVGIMGAICLLVAKPIESTGEKELTADH